MLEAAAVLLFIVSSPNGPSRRSQQLEDIWRQSAGQILPCFLPRHVPQFDVGFELGNQQPNYVLMAMDCRNVEGCVATR